MHCLSWLFVKINDTLRESENGRLEFKDQETQCWTLSWFSFLAGTADGDKEDKQDYSRMVERDRHRWDKADQNQDGRLTKEEFADFLHPEDVPHMKEVVIDVSSSYIQTSYLCSAS